MMSVCVFPICLKCRTFHFSFKELNTKQFLLKSESRVKWFIKNKHLERVYNFNRFQFQKYRNIVKTQNTIDENADCVTFKKTNFIWFTEKYSIYSILYQERLWFNINNSAFNNWIEHVCYNDILSRPKSDSAICYP